MFLSRYTIAAAPAVYLLLACAIWGVRRIVPPLLSLFPAGGPRRAGTPCLLCGAVQRAVAGDGGVRERRVQAGGLGLLSPNALTQGWEWYYGGELPECPREVGRMETSAVLEALERCAAAQPRIWVVLRNERATTTCCPTRSSPRERAGSHSQRSTITTRRDWSSWSRRRAQVSTDSVCTSVPCRTWAAARSYCSLFTRPPSLRRGRSSECGNADDPDSRGRCGSGAPTSAPS